MKWYGAVFLLSVLLSASVSSARTLEDVLKEKGVITEEDFRSITKKSQTDYRIGQGFTFTSADEKFRLSLGTSFQLRYTFQDLDDVNDGATKDKQVKNGSRFDLRRIKLNFNGYAFSPDLTYRMVVNFSNSQNPSTTNGLLEETWMNYRVRDWLQVRFGQDKVPFGRQFITQTSQLQLVDQSPVTTAFVPGIDTGLMLHGKAAETLCYNVAVYGGLGQNTYRATSDNAVAARIMVNPLGDFRYSESDLENSPKPLVSAGASYYRVTLNDKEKLAGGNNIAFAGSKGWYGLGNALFTSDRQMSAAEAVTFNTGEADVAFKWRGFSAQAEYFLGFADGSESDNTLRAHGFYVQAGYLIIPAKLEIAARYSYIDPNRDMARDHLVETTGGVSYYFTGHSLKLQADYTNSHRQPAIAYNKGPEATDDHIVRFQAQIIF